MEDVLALGDLSPDLLLGFQAQGAQGQQAVIELGVINIGGPGLIVVDGTTYEIGHEEALYVGKQVQDILAPGIGPHHA